MKTIAITLDEASLKEIDQLVGKSAGRNRSRLIREAVRRYLDDLRQREQEARDREIYRRHRKLIAQQARALIRDQAAP